MKDFFNLNYVNLDFNLKFKGPAKFPPYKGTTIRGALGMGFKNTVCLYKKRSCAECPFKEKCSFAYNFETPVTKNAPVLKKYQNAPHPFIIIPDSEKKQEFYAGDNFAFTIRLFEKGILFYAYYIEAFRHIEKNGIGIKENRGKFVLTEVNLCNKPIFRNGDFLIENFSECVFKPKLLRRPIKNLTLEFITPAKIIENGKVTLKPTFRTIIKSLLWRYSLIKFWHSDHEPFSSFYKELIHKSEQVTISNLSIEPVRIKRFSTRKKVYMELLGFMGVITFAGELSEFIPLLQIGEIINIGHNTSFGFGRFKIINMQ